jgi:hypothetical protein
VLGQEFASILARTDPFDVAQALERYTLSLTGDQLRLTINAARSHLNEGYSSEFLPLLDEGDNDRLKAKFVHALKSNLRAIPLFGPAFCEGVMENVPGDRTVALGEETPSFPSVPPMMFVALAVAVLIGIAAVQHLLNNARATAETPVVAITPAPLIAPSLTPIALAAPAHVPHAAPTMAAHNHKLARAAAATARPQIARTPAATPASPPPPALVAGAPVTRAVTAHAVVARAPVPHPTLAARPRTVVAGAGVKTVVAGPPKATPAPEPTEVDVSDMPRSYTDATPLPKEQAPFSAQVTSPSVAVPTPTPGPNRSWTHRLVHLGVHLVNTTLTTIGVAKRPPKSTPSPTSSPPGPLPR